MKTKGLIGSLIAVVLVMGLGGCTTTRQSIAKPHATEANVFTEVSDGQSTPKGKVALIVRASYKTPTREHFLLESRTPPPAENGYAFELNIDGQEAIWKVKGNLENTPISGAEGRLPEGGEGIRYVLEKKLRLAPGSHHVVFGLPYDNYYTEVKVTLKEGETHTLEFKPVYEPNRTGYETYHRGIKNYQSSFDGTRIR